VTPEKEATVLYQRLADAVVLIHFFWILFLIGGGWWGRRYRLVGWVHIIGLSYAFLVEIFNWYCPLTDLEVWLRGKGAQTEYHGSFITHYVNKLIYLDVPHSPIVILTLLLCLGNLWLYFYGRRG
jgi:hypothetical protein